MSTQFLHKKANFSWKCKFAFTRPQTGLICVSSSIKLLARLHLSAWFCCMDLRGEKARLQSSLRRVFTWGQKCAIRMIIWVTVILMTVFWPVCTQISIIKGNLNCAIQMMVRRYFPVTRLSNHAAKSPYELTCKLWFFFFFWFFFGGGGGGGATWPSNHFRC